MTEDRVGEKSKDRECLEDANQASCDSRDRCRFGDEEPSPGIKKSCQRTVAVAHINILAAGLRFHGSQFGVGERAEKREQPSNQPCQIDQLGRTNGLHHFGGNEKNSAADDGADHNRSRVTHTKIASQLGTGFHGLNVSWHAASRKYKRKTLKRRGRKGCAEIAEKFASAISAAIFRVLSDLRL